MVIILTSGFRFQMEGAPMEPEHIPPTGGNFRNIEKMHRAGAKRAAPDLLPLKKIQ
jgi:hypothetical protein